MDPLRIVVRVVVAYVFALVLVRMSGKRDVRQLDITGFIVVLIIGDMFDDFLLNEIPAAQFIVGIGTLFLVHVTSSLQSMHAGTRVFRRRHAGGRLGRR